MHLKKLFENFLTELLYDHLFDLTTTVALGAGKSAIHKISGNTIWYVHQGTPRSKRQTLVYQSVFDDLISFLWIHGLNIGWPSYLSQAVT